MRKSYAKSIQLQTNKQLQISTCKAIDLFIRDFHLIAAKSSLFFIYNK